MSADSKEFREKFLQKFDADDVERLRERKITRDIKALIDFVEYFRSEMYVTKRVSPGEFHVAVKITDTNTLYISGDQSVKALDEGETGMETVLSTLRGNIEDTRRVEFVIENGVEN